MNVFIGSTTEQLDLVDEVSLILEQNGHVPIAWNKPGLFLPGNFTADRLIDIAKNQVDAAIFIFSPDDKVWYRGNEKAQPRDNVVYEHGLFSGLLGLNKAIILNYGNNTKLPTDLSGLTYINYNNKSRSKLELKEWLKSITKNNLNKEYSQNIDFNNPDLSRFLSFHKDMRGSIIDFISEVYWSYDIQDCELDEYLTFVLTKFINQFLSINDARFTIRAYDEESNSMVTYKTTRDDAIPGPIPLDKPNLITESALQNKPLIYSENKDFHYTTKNQSIKKGTYKDYVTYCLLETNQNRPIYSLCLDVKNQSSINKMRTLVHSLVFEIICNAIIEKFLIEIEKTELENNS